MSIKDRGFASVDPKREYLGEPQAPAADVGPDAGRPTVMLTL
jgi:hypothetical protein